MADKRTLAPTLPTAKHRSRLQIIADILDTIKGKDGAKKTHIMYQANLSYSLLCRYLDEVQGAGLAFTNAYSEYVITEKGRVFLAKFREYSERRRRVVEGFNSVQNDESTLESMCSPELSP